MIEVFGTYHATNLASDDNRAITIKNRAEFVRTILDKPYNAVCVELRPHGRGTFNLDVIIQNLSMAGALKGLYEIETLGGFGGSMIKYTQIGRRWASEILLDEETLSMAALDEWDLATIAMIATGREIWSCEPYEPTDSHSLFHDGFESKSLEFYKNIREPLVLRNARQVEENLKDRGFEEPGVLIAVGEGHREHLEHLLSKPEDELRDAILKAVEAARDNKYQEFTDGEEPDTAQKLVIEGITGAQ